MSMESMQCMECMQSRLQPGNKWLLTLSVSCDIFQSDDDMAGYDNTRVKPDRVKKILHDVFDLFIEIESIKVDYLDATITGKIPHPGCIYDIFDYIYVDPADTWQEGDITVYVNKGVPYELSIGGLVVTHLRPDFDNVGSQIQIPKFGSRAPNTIDMDA